MLTLCDIYEAKCKECGRGIPFHLGDFLTGREEIEVYCWDCLPTDMTDCYLILIHVPNLASLNPRMRELVEEEREFWGKVVCVCCLTDNAKENYMWNHPNLLLKFTFIPVGGWAKVVSE